MRDIDTIPPLTLWPTQETQQSWRYLEAQTPVDFTQRVAGIGYSAELLILRKTEVRHRIALDLTADGYLSATIPAAVSQDMRSCKRIDACGQITITAPIPEMTVIWKFPVVVQEIAA